MAGQVRNKKKFFAVGRGGFARRARAWRLCVSLVRSGSAHSLKIYKSLKNKKFFLRLSFRFAWLSRLPCLRGGKTSLFASVARRSSLKSFVAPYSLVKSLFSHLVERPLRQLAQDGSPQLAQDGSNFFLLLLALPPSRPFYAEILSFFQIFARLL